MRILHTSDWHLGRVLHETPLLEDQRGILGQIIAHCAAKPCDALAVSGDVFDRSLPSEDAVRLWSGFLKDLREACPELPLLVIAGNHDSAARIAYAAEALTLARIHVRGGPEAIERPIGITSALGERMQVWMIPFLWAGDFDEGEARVRTQEESLAAAIARIRGHQDPGALQLALAHCFARGAKASDSERVLVGTATDVDAGIFEGFDYTALGHLHRRQRVADRVHYSGSPLPYSFSEAGDEKALLEVELHAGLPPQITPLPLIPARPLRRLQGALRDLLEDPRFAQDEACLVEITLSQGDAGTQPFALLKQRFPGLLHLRYKGDEALPGERLVEERSSDLLSDYRQFAADIGHGAELIELRTALAETFAGTLSRQGAL